MKTLREVRKDKGVKVGAIAKHLGISRQTYSKYENHPESMSVTHAQAACDFLGVPVTEIFFTQEGKSN